MHKNLTKHNNEHDKARRNTHINQKEANEGRYIRYQKRKMESSMERKRQEVRKIVRNRQVRVRYSERI